MTDLVALKAVHRHLWSVMTTAELAAALGVADDEAADRIAALTKEGHLCPSMQVRSEDGVMSEAGVKLTESGCDLLGAEESRLV